MVDVVITIDEKGITAKPDPVRVPKRHPDVPICWTIATPGWSFTDDGIVIHWNLNQFTARKRKSGKVFCWRSRNTNTKTYKYTINVVNGATQASCDPGIKNGGR
jgi:hypothetical protein